MKQNKTQLMSIGIAPHNRTKFTLNPHIASTVSESVKATTTSNDITTHSLSE